MSLEDALYPLRACYEAAPQGLKSLAGRCYRALPEYWRFGAEYERFKEEALDSAQWSVEEVRAYQVAAIRESLLAANAAAFYRERFAAAGVRPGEFEALEQLSEYPLLAKQDLLVNREAMVNPKLPASQRLYLTTGGSSGVPVGFYLHNGVSRAKELAYLEAQWGRCGYAPGDRVAVIRGGVTSSRVAGGISSYDAARDWLVLSSYHLTEARVGEYVRALNGFKPKHLLVYPSAGLMLARLMVQAGMKLEFPLVSVLCGSEKLTPEMRAELEGAFGARVCHWYGHSERVVLAGDGGVKEAETMGDGGAGRMPAALGTGETPILRFWPGYGFVEFGEPNEEGFREVIGTSFHNLVMPLIRYRTGDYVRVVSDEGAAWPTISAVAGREHEFLLSGTGRRISLTAMNMHDAIFDGLLTVQFHQAAQGVVELRYVPGAGFKPERETMMRAGVMEKLGDDFTLTLRAVETVEKTSAGKCKWLVSTLDKSYEV